MTDKDRKEEIIESVFNKFKKTTKYPLLNLFDSKTGEPTIHNITFTWCMKEALDLAEQRHAKQLEEIVKKVKESPRIVNEGDLQNMKEIELSYTGELIPVEEVEELLKSKLKEASG